MGGDPRDGIRGDLTLGDLLTGVLARAGVTGAYGEALAGGEGPAVVRVASAVADRFAEAHRRVIGGRAVVVTSTGLRIAATLAAPGEASAGQGVEARPPETSGTVSSVAVRSAADLEHVASLLAAGAALDVTVDADLAAPAQPLPPPPPDPSPYDADLDTVVAALAAAHRPIVLAGPGVVDAGAVSGLAALAAAGSLGVLNTWGAKGVFNWRSRHHLATVGLQALDLDLGGVADADLVLTTGLDAAESPPHLLSHVATLDVPPSWLAPLAERWSRPHQAIAMPELRARLGAATQAGWAHTGRPVWPTTATLAYAQVLGPAGLVAADAGEAGFWVARTFGTTSLRSAHVPATIQPGLAVACATVARLAAPGRPALAVVDAAGARADAWHVAVEAAAALGVPVAVECWDPDGPALDADEHRRRLTALVASPVGGEVALAVDPAQAAVFEEAAGERIAWRSPR